MVVLLAIVTLSIFPGIISGFEHGFIDFIVRGVSGVTAIIRASVTPAFNTAQRVTLYSL
jgi:hypothetical protein